MDSSGEIEDSNEFFDSVKEELGRETLLKLLILLKSFTVNDTDDSRDELLAKVYEMIGSKEDLVRRFEDLFNNPGSRAGFDLDPDEYQEKIAELMEDDKPENVAPERQEHVFIVAPVKKGQRQPPEIPSADRIEHVWRLAFNMEADESDAHPLVEERGNAEMPPMEIDEIGRIQRQQSKDSGIDILQERVAAEIMQRLRPRERAIGMNLDNINERMELNIMPRQQFRFRPFMNREELSRRRNTRITLAERIRRDENRRPQPQMNNQMEVEAEVPTPSSEGRIKRAANFDGHQRTKKSKLDQSVSRDTQRESDDGESIRQSSQPSTSFLDDRQAELDRVRLALGIIKAIKMKERLKRGRRRQSVGSEPNVGEVEYFEKSEYVAKVQKLNEDALGMLEEVLEIVESKYTNRTSNSGPSRARPETLRLVESVVDKVEKEYSKQTRSGKAFVLLSADILQAVDEVMKIAAEGIL